MQRPEVATLLLAFDRDCKRALRAYPPFGSVERPFPVEWLTAPASELRLPDSAWQEAVQYHNISMAGGHVFLPMRDNPLGRNDAVIFKNFADIGQWLYVNLCI